MKAKQKCFCQLRPENAKSWPQKDDSGRKTTTRVAAWLLKAFEVSHAANKIELEDFRSK